MQQSSSSMSPSIMVLRDLTSLSVIDFCREQNAVYKNDHVYGTGWEVEHPSGCVPVPLFTWLPVINRIPNATSFIVM